jgi:hypothetical protein
MEKRGLLLPNYGEIGCFHRLNASLSKDEQAGWI